MNENGKNNLQPGQSIWFTLPGKRRRNGEVIAPLDGGYRIQGKREASKYRAPIFHVPYADIQTQAGKSGEVSR